MVKVLYLSPIAAHESHDGLFADMARDYKRPGTEVHVASLPVAAGNFRHIEYLSYEATVKADVIRATRAASREGFDAFAIGCFYDTALHDAREISGDMFVTAPCVASCEIAASLSNRFGIIVSRRKCIPKMEANVRELGYWDRLTGFYPVDLLTSEFQEDHERTERLLLEAGRKAVEEDYAESLVLGCTLEVGFHREIERRLGVPVIDPAIAVLKRAEYGAFLKHDCDWKPSRKWSCEAPPENEIASIGVFETEEPFGPRIVVPAN